MTTYYIGVLHTFKVGDYTATETLETHKAIGTNELDKKIAELRESYRGFQDTRIHVNSDKGIADITVKTWEEK